MSDYDSILVSLRRITRAIDLQSKKLQQKLGLTVSQLRILQTLRKEGQLSSSAIAKITMLSQATVTAILDRMEQGGLITRERSTDDKRVVNIRISDKGLKELSAAPELPQAGFLREFRCLEDREKSLLVSSL